MKKGLKPKSLTPEKLARLKFVKDMHLNGGSTHSLITSRNDEYGLFVSTVTDGSPNYRITKKVLTAVIGNDEVELDLRAKDQRTLRKAFCEAYNRKQRGES